MPRTTRGPRRWIAQFFFLGGCWEGDPRRIGVAHLCAAGREEETRAARLTKVGRHGGEAARTSPSAPWCSALRETHSRVKSAARQQKAGHETAFGDCPPPGPVAAHAQAFGARSP